MSELGRDDDCVRRDWIADLHRRFDAERECPDHWHCDPVLAAHECANDRSAPCPTCGAF